MSKREDKQNREVAKEVIADKTKPELLRAKQFIETIKAYKKYDKYYKTYFKGIKKAIEYNGEPRVYVENKLDGTKTGRFSCTAYQAGKKNKMGVSFHTVPRPNKITNIRRLFRNELGAFLTSDYSGMELRVLAHVSGDAGLLRAFTSGEDPHRYTASLIFAKDVKDVTAEERQLAKAVSFLVVYGGQAAKLAETAKISLTKANAILEKLKDVYPGVFEWMEEMHLYIMQHKQAPSLFGGIRHLPDIDSKEQEIVWGALRQGVNFFIQRSASDILAYSAMDVDKEILVRGLTSEFKQTVHDSLECDVVVNEIQEVTEIVYDKMINYPTLKKLGFIFKCPLKIETIIGHSFGDGEEVHYDKQGKITNLEKVLEYLK